MTGKTLLRVRDLKVHFPVASESLFGEKRWLKAVDGVSFELDEHETLGIVGESGCGKSTLARALLRLVPLAGGEVEFAGRNLATLEDKAMRAARRDIQMIFQDPLASLDPRMTVGKIIDEPLATLFPKMRRGERTRRVRAMMERVGLLPNQINRYAHEFSGGQAQRIGIARALVVEPTLVVCDEPVSALDVSIKSQVINLLQDLQRELGLSLIFIAHDLGSVRHISRRVVVLYLGKVMEIADSTALYNNPRHPYTQMLIAAAPIADPGIARQRDLKVVRGELPSPLAPPSGCPFRTRCTYAIERCAQEGPALREVGASRVACHRADEPAVATAFTKARTKE
ncbi:MAG: ABC transporter ATP-binding protein [Gammaproteobacteria bacterium]